MEMINTIPPDHIVHDVAATLFWTLASSIGVGGINGSKAWHWKTSRARSLSPPSNPKGLFGRRVPALPV